ncbi:sensor histidine kinase [Candidatus Poriferisodalis sp.]|uniref:sensor histidine kinase n=1 Tax=Candidatus Poriferisodalis sp. TaxID=3101277 RepID=UPI003B018779
MILLASALAAVSATALALALVMVRSMRERAVAAERLESQAAMAAATTAAARRDAARWQLAIDELAVGVVLADEDGSVCATNAVANEMLAARDAMALVGAGLGQLLASAGDGRERSRTVKLTGPPPRVIEISARQLGSDNDPLGAVAVMADRTEGVRTDEVRRDFVANLSHELRTPVGAISLLAETLADEGDPKVRCRLVDRISAEADRVRHIIDDLLELSRVELEGSTRHAPVSVVPLLREVAKQYSEHAREHGVSLVFPPDAAGDAELSATHAQSQIVLHADRGQLLRAVGNLVDNAIKYSDPGAQVRLAVLPSSDARPSAVLAEADASVTRTGHRAAGHQDASSAGSSDSRARFDAEAPAAQTQVDETQGAAWWDIVVDDQGIGIPADETERVFERFYRVDKARARATGGTGLGLSIVRHIAMNHGGEVMLHTREGVGTRFTLRLPASGVLERRDVIRHEPTSVSPLPRTSSRERATANT